MTMAKQTYASTRFTMAAGRQNTINMYGRFLTILENSLVANPEISIDGDPFYEIPQGVSIKVEPFSKVEFKNPTASSMSLWVAMSAGEIWDNRANFTGLLSIMDITDAIETPAPIVALPLDFLINNAAAVDKGGGLVGIPLTAQPFATGESVTNTGTVNYNGAYVVDASSSANEVVITATYVAETFDGVDDRIGLSTPRSVAADSTRKEIVVHNHNGTYKVYWGDANIDPAGNRGIPIPCDAAYIIPNTGQIFFAAEAGAGVTGCIISYANMTST